MTYMVFPNEVVKGGEGGAPPLLYSTSFVDAMDHALCKKGMWSMVHQDDDLGVFKPPFWAPCFVTVVDNVVSGSFFATHYQPPDLFWIQNWDGTPIVSPAYDEIVEAAFEEAKAPKSKSSVVKKPSQFQGNPSDYAIISNPSEIYVSTLIMDFHHNDLVILAYRGGMTRYENQFSSIKKGTFDVKDMAFRPYELLRII